MVVCPKCGSSEIVWLKDKPCNKPNVDIIHVYYCVYCESLVEEEDCED